MRFAAHAALILLLTLLTQLGGVAWGLACLFRRRLLAFGMFYALLWTVAFWAAPLLGREALPCFGTQLRMQSPAYCLLMRNYVSPDMAAVAHDAAVAMAATNPGTITLALDGGFPFLNGMPLLPHLSHDDGAKLDLAYFYANTAGAYLPGQTRSPIGYWAFELDNATDCPSVWLTTRWDLTALQSLWPNRPLDAARTRNLAQALLDDPRVAKMFLEPALAARLGLSDPKLRFQGCRAARHDDHIHIQL